MPAPERLARIFHTPSAATGCGQPPLRSGPDFPWTVCTHTALRKIRSARCGDAPSRRLPTKRYEKCGLDWYDTPLYYDIIFDEDTVAEANFLETVHRRHGQGGKGGKSVLELACGSGRLVREFAARGWRSAGFDANATMLDFARSRLAAEGLKAQLWEDRMERFVAPRSRRFDLVHCLVSTFKYLRTEEDALSCLRRVADALRPGGIFVLGIHLTDPRITRPSHERWVASRDGIEVVCNTRTWPPDTRRRCEAMRSRLRITLPDSTVRLQETHWEVRSYNAAQLRSLVGKEKTLSLVACHDFRHDPEDHRKLDDSYSDIVLVLRRE